jgi:spoIIIJ-associated protein
MTDKIESKGKTVDEAVNEALLQMGARRDEVKVEVLDEGKSGLFGILGGRQARVVVSRKASRGPRGRKDFRENKPDAVTHQLHDDDGGKSEDGGRGRRRGRRGGRGQRGDQDRGDTRQAGGNSRGRRKSPGQQDGQENRNNQEEAREGRPRSGRSGRSERSERSDRSDRSDGRNSDGGERSERSSRSRRGRRRSGGSGGSGKRDEGRPVEARNEESAAQNQSRGRGDSQNAGGRSEERQPNERGDKRRPTRERRSRRARPAQADGEQQRPPSAQIDNRPAEDVSMDKKKGQAHQENRGPEETIVTGIPATRYAEPLRGVTEEGLDQALFDLTNGMLIRAGFPVRCEVKPGEYRQIKIVTDDSSAGMLIGRHGSAVDSIEHLVERMAGIAAGDWVKMNLDINNYRRRRQDTLQDKVADAIDLVLDQGKPYHMETMNPRERRMVHLQVEPIDGVRTFTMGGGGGKHVVIAPDDGSGDGDQESSKKENRAEAQEDPGSAETEPVGASPEQDFDEFDDGPQPETNELVIDDGEDLPRYP